MIYEVRKKFFLFILAYRQLPRSRARDIQDCPTEECTYIAQGGASTYSRLPPALDSARRRSSRDSFKPRVRLERVRRGVPGIIREDGAGAVEVVLTVALGHNRSGGSLKAGVFLHAGYYAPVGPAVNAMWESPGGGRNIALPCS